MRLEEYEACMVPVVGSCVAFAFGAAITLGMMWLFVRFVA